MSSFDPFNRNRNRYAVKVVRGSGAVAPGSRPAVPAANYTRAAGASVPNPGSPPANAQARSHEPGTQASSSVNHRASAEEQSPAGQPIPAATASTPNRPESAPNPTPTVVGGGGSGASVGTEDGPLSDPTPPEVSPQESDGPPGPASDTTEATTTEAEPEPNPPEDQDPLTTALAERDAYLQLAQRTQADFENFRKRKARDAEVAESRANARFAKELLPALDNLGRAVSAAAADDPLLAGVRLVHTDLVSALARLGIESFSPEGELFNPVEHEAVAHTPVEGAQAGTVVEVYQAGYRANGNILRPARVVVAA